MKRIYRSKDDVKICGICAGAVITFDLGPQYRVQKTSLTAGTLGAIGLKLVIRKAIDIL
jgi:phage shock protein PspC (stress-responsive transcriptional regulator)